MALHPSSKRISWENCHQRSRDFCRNLLLVSTNLFIKLLIPNRWTFMCFNYNEKIRQLLYLGSQYMGHAAVDDAMVDFKMAHKNLDIVTVAIYRWPKCQLGLPWCTWRLTKCRESKCSKFVKYWKVEQKLFMAYLKRCQLGGQITSQIMVLWIVMMTEQWAPTSL